MRASGVSTPARRCAGGGGAAAAAAPAPPLRARRAARAALRVHARGGGFGRGAPPMGGGGGPGGGGGGGGGTAWDPEGLLGAPREGLIERRMMQKQMEKDQEFAAAIMATKDDIRKQVLLRRSQRSPPDDPAELCEYFLSTNAEDMEFEVARCRPKLTPEFFKALDGLIGAARFKAPPSGLVSAQAAAQEDAAAAEAAQEERLAELELLRTYLEEASEAVDKAVVSTSSAVDRMKKLLTAKDKKAAIIEMAEANEIDVPLMDLLQQNIDGARAAGQDEAAAFMEKVKQAASKYLITAAPVAGASAVPAAPAALAGAGAPTSAGGLILPGSAPPPPPAQPGQQRPEEKKLII
ncbi:hypothetical protein Rsub_04716 [Raphidocelis subcapitata]|uniref:Uncharacterized protein n=1 Tax=Raphidocelis subcapitata TaxID=307507 RepID=A0A2V0NZ89_9CHLO|nr:hypothetical protein Rsub_04716 [Raphidocelis subcapitata]|eukprot:GBF91992.1 hypothetical protein Rsub_04716 [Raphidocelis subcapitata]